MYESRFKKTIIVHFPEQVMKINLCPCIYISLYWHIILFHSEFNSKVEYHLASTMCKQEMLIL